MQESLVKESQFGREYSIRGHSVENDLVRDQIQPVLEVAHSDQNGAQQRRPVQLERVAYLLTDNAQSCVLALLSWKIGDRNGLEPDRLERVYTLQGRACRRLECAPPDFMTTNDFIEGPFKHGYI